MTERVLGPLPEGTGRPPRGTGRRTTLAAAPAATAVRRQPVTTPGRALTAHSWRMTPHDAEQGGRRRCGPKAVSRPTPQRGVARPDLVSRVRQADPFLARGQPRPDPGRLSRVRPFRVPRYEARRVRAARRHRCALPPHPVPGRCHPPIARGRRCLRCGWRRRGPRRAAPALTAGVATVRDPRDRDRRLPPGRRGSVQASRIAGTRRNLPGWPARSGSGRVPKPSSAMGPAAGRSRPSV